MKDRLPVFSAIVPLIVALLALPGCNLKEKYAANNAAADSWLASKGGSAGTNISGSWESRELGWGAIRFEQQGGRVSGAMGNYSVKGRVAGSRAYLALSANGWVHYLVVLTRSGSNLSGFYSSSIPFDPANQAAVNLYRIGN